MCLLSAVRRVCGVSKTLGEEIVLTSFIRGDGPRQVSTFFFFFFFKITTCVLGCVSLAAGGDLRALTEGSGHDRKGGAEDQDGDAATDDLLKRGKRKLEKEPFIELFFCFPLPSAHRVCTAPPPPPPPLPLHVKLVPLIVRLVGLKLLITASRPPSSFQALFHWRRHGCLTRPRHSSNSLPSEEVPRRERQEGTSFTHPPHPHPSSSSATSTPAPPPR